MSDAAPLKPHIDAALVRTLLAEQFPHWAGLVLTPVASAGTDNALFHLGDRLVVRLPKVDWAAGQPGKEQLWLPKLAPHLPLAIPKLVGFGAPGGGYPWTWSVCEWLNGEPATSDRLVDPSAAARGLAAFIRALQGINPTGGPASGAHNHYRGVPLAGLDPAVRSALVKLHGKIDVDVAGASAVWDAATAIDPWRGPPVWLHGDLHDRNLLATEGRLSAVIDFGLLGVGDPACDLMVAWTMFDGAARTAFREAMAVDEATWRRGRGWALYSGVIALPHYWDSNPVLVAGCLRTVAEVLADVAGERDPQVRTD